MLAPIIFLHLNQMVEWLKEIYRRFFNKLTRQVIFEIISAAFPQMFLSHMPGRY